MTAERTERCGTSGSTSSLSAWNRNKPFLHITIENNSDVWNSVISVSYTHLCSWMFTVAAATQLLLQLSLYEHSGVDINSNNVAEIHKTTNSYFCCLFLYPSTCRLLFLFLWVSPHYIYGFHELKIRFSLD